MSMNATTLKGAMITKVNAKNPDFLPNIGTDMD